MVYEQDDNNNSDDDQSMQLEGGDASKTKGKTATIRQNEKLYAAEGMLNTRMKRAEKKRRKKVNKANTSDDDMDDDYNFKVDYVKKRSAMEVGDDGNHLGQIVAKVPMSGIGFDKPEE